MNIQRGDRSAEWRNKFRSVQAVFSRFKRMFGLNVGHQVCACCSFGDFSEGFIQHIEVSLCLSNRSLCQIIVCTRHADLAFCRGVDQVDIFARVFFQNFDDFSLCAATTSPGLVLRKCFWHICLFIDSLEVFQRILRIGQRCFCFCHGLFGGIRCIGLSHCLCVSKNLPTCVNLFLPVQNFGTDQVFESLFRRCKIRLSFGKRLCCGRDCGGRCQFVHRCLCLSKLDFCLRVVQLCQYLTRFHLITDFDIDLTDLSAGIKPKAGFFGWYYCSCTIGV